MNPSYNVQIQAVAPNGALVCWRISKGREDIELHKRIKRVSRYPTYNYGRRCVILIDDEGRLLLQQRTDNGLWGLPGGSMEPGENMKEVASRELFEEVGLEAEELELLDIFSGPDAKLRIFQGTL